MYDGSTGLPTGEVNDAHAVGIYSVCFTPDGTKFVTASADKSVKLWDTTSLACEQTFVMSTDPQVGDMQVSVLWARGFLISLSLNGSINLFDVSSPSPIRTIEAHQGAITAMDYDAASKTVFTGSFDGVVCAYNIEDCSCLVSLWRIFGIWFS
jgi:WD40 repeat protein